MTPTSHRLLQRAEREEVILESASRASAALTVKSDEDTRKVRTAAHLPHDDAYKLLTKILAKHIQESMPSRAYTGNSLTFPKYINIIYHINRIKQKIITSIEAGKVT